MAKAAKINEQTESTDEESGDLIRPGQILTISPPRFDTVTMRIVGTAPYMQARFSEKAKAMMREKMLAGSQAKKGKAREARDFGDDYRAAMYLFPDGGHGIPAYVFRNACISACRVIGFKMTLAKLAIFVEQDGFDVVDGVTPLVRLTGTPKPLEMATRNATGVADLRVRPCWDPGWSAVLRIRYDSQIFQAGDVLNLIARVGVQVGIGEGRPDSKSSAGLGYGLFEVHSDVVMLNLPPKAA